MHYISMCLHLPYLHSLHKERCLSTAVNDKSFWWITFSQSDAFMKWLQNKFSKWISWIGYSFCIWGIIMQLWSYWKALMQMFRKQNYLNHPKLLLCNVFATDLSHCLIVLCLSWIMASSGCGNEVSSEVWAMSTLFGWKIVHPVQNFSLKIWIYWLSVRL